MAKKRRHGFLITSLLLSCLAAPACVPRAQPYPPSEFEAETEDRAWLEGNTETRIPRDAEEVHGYVSGFQELTTYARFTIRNEQLGEFLSSTACALPLATTDRRAEFQDSMGFEWWRPIDARRFQWCEGTKEHLSQRVFIDSTDGASVVVYVVASMY